MNATNAINATNDPPLIWAEVDLSAIAHNVAELRRRTDPKAKLMAVVKADGYGHGAVEVARTALASGAEWLGVARLPEAIALREAGFSAPILVLGYTQPSAADRLIEYDLKQSVYSMAAAQAYSSAAVSRGKRIQVHLKVDTGMGRLGIVPAALAGHGAGSGVGEEFIRAATAIARLPGLDAEGIFTHFAAADSANTSYAKRQLSLFLEVLSALRTAGLEFAVRHAANSAAVIQLPESHLDLVRPGIALYGLKPSEEVNLAGISLQPAMALKTRIIHLKSVPAGTCYQLRHDPSYAVPDRHRHHPRRLRRRLPPAAVLARADVGARPPRSGRRPGVHGSHHAGCRRSPQRSDGRRGCHLRPPRQRVHIGGRHGPRSRHHQLRNRLRPHRPGAEGLSRQLTS